MREKYKILKMTEMREIKGKKIKNYRKQTKTEM